MSPVREPVLRHWVVVLGDQLDRHSSAFDGFDPAQDRVWMCEASDESTHVWSAKPRIVAFLSAMRHFASALRDDRVPLYYLPMHDGTLADALASTLAALPSAGVVVAHPGDWRVLQALRAAAQAAGVPIDVREDRHFLCSAAEFAAHAKRRRGALRMEYFYREMRVRHRVLMTDPGDEPAGGRWNFDTENRRAFGPHGPGLVPPPLRFPPDTTTLEVMALVEQRFAAHPGHLADHAWPATRAQALQALGDFITHRLPEFGLWQDAMWEGQPWLYHAQLSMALNLKLLDPREVIAAAEAAWRAGHAPLAAAEGFIRQILGWREYVRGVYWHAMPGYLQRNELDAHLPLPAWYWTGEVPMRCLRDVIGQTLRFGYAHHIQRLMVTGLYALLLGVDPQAVHGWYLSVYVDAVEWVELPNTLGMSQYADGGTLASKPYVASGRYIERMSDHCRGCAFDPAQRTGPRACPFTTLYWDFLLRHARRFAGHARFGVQVQRVRELDGAERDAIARRASALRRSDWQGG